MSKSLAGRILDSLPLNLGRLVRQARDERAAARPRKTRHGFMLAGAEVLFRPDWEEHELAVFIKHLPDADVCVDIGANAGYYTCLAASKGKRVLAVEPLAGNLTFLYNNLRANDICDIVEVYPMGFSARPSLQRIYGKSDIASFVKGWHGQETDFTLVPTIDMDLVVGSRFAGKQLLIKLDVEGFEADVLQGAKATLALEPRPVWLVEAFVSAPVGNISFSDTFPKIFETFWAHGYKAQTIGPSLQDITPADIVRWVDQQRSDGSANYLFTAA